MGDLGGVTQVKVNFDSENKCILQNNYVKFQPFGKENPSFLTKSAQAAAAQRPRPGQRPAASRQLAARLAASSQPLAAGRGWRQLAAGGWPQLAAVAEMCQKCETNVKKNMKNIGAGPVAPVHGLVGCEVEVRGSRARELPFFRGAFVAARFSKFAHAQNVTKV